MQNQPSSNMYMCICGSICGGEAHW